MSENTKGPILNKNQRTFVCVGVLLIAALSFFLGYLTKSGGDNAPPPPQSEVAEGNKGFSGNGLESVPASSEDGLPDKKAELVKESELTFFKSLSKVPSKTSKSNSDTKTTVPKKEVVAAPKSDIRPKKRAEVNKASHNKKSSVEDLQKMFTIQVASFKKMEDASLLKDRLERKGYDSYIMIFSSDDTKWFRVRIGAVHTKDEANALVVKLKAKEKLGAYIARYTR